MFIVAIIINSKRVMIRIRFVISFGVLFYAELVSMIAFFDAMRRRLSSIWLTRNGLQVVGVMK